MDLAGISYQQMLDLQGVIPVRVIDVRSPQEFLDDHIPGAENLPLFDNDQRCMVGTLYAKESPEVAYQQGLVFAEQRLEWILSQVIGRPIGTDTWHEKFSSLKTQVSALQVNAISSEQIRNSFVAGNTEAELKVVHCWRGGMRSRALVALLHELGHTQTLVLVNGYKSYRNWVLGQLESFNPNTQMVALRGPTGVGKTQILHQLEERSPGSTLDLEACAGHRSSILGAIGLRPVSQKSFESNLLARISELGPAPWFVEGESRKVGNVVIPDQIFQAMESAKQVYVEASLAHRCEALAKDYISTESRKQELREQLPFFEERIAGCRKGKLQAMLDNGNWREVATVLLKEYYDPLYGHSDRRRNWDLKINAEQEDMFNQLESVRMACVR